jgi:putative ATP-binding cassette transporter
VCLVGYAAVGTWLTVVIGRRLVLINFDQQRYEADYRFALVHARDNAEQIALYQGTRDEARQLSSRFARVLRNFKLLIPWQRHLTFFSEAYDDAANLVLISSSQARTFPGISNWANSPRPLTRSRCFKALCHYNSYRSFPEPH